MPYQYVREPLTAEEADRLANACETPTEQLIVWTLLDTGLRVSELCALTSKERRCGWAERGLTRLSVPMIVGPRIRPGPLTIAAWRPAITIGTDQISIRSLERCNRSRVV
jgi:integrase